MSNEYTFSTSYGKLRVPIYRVYARPLLGVKPIPESPYSGSKNILFAYEIDVEVLGENFLPAYTHGDNSNVVATDSMKNFVIREALTFDGATLEEFLDTLGHHFLEMYAQMQQLRLAGRELPFAPTTIPDEDEFTQSSVLFQRTHTDYTTATLTFERLHGTPALIDHRCGRMGLELFKVTGSAFSRFVRDEYTTLAERVDRPLFIFLDVYWKYSAVQMLIATNHEQYVPAEQLRDLIQVVFHEFVSESIQHLVHEMGIRILARYPQLAEVSFEAQNRTRDVFVTSEVDEKVKVYSDPFSAYGMITLTVKRQV